MRELQRKTKRISTGVWRQINRRSTAGLAWKQQGDFITFKWDGFVAAPSIPLLFARHNYETAVIKRVVGDQDVQRSLEFGCGFGRLTPTFADLSAHHTAIDINPDALAAARSAYPHLEFAQSTGGRLPFDNDTFDLIVTWTVLQHVPPDLIETTLADIVRVLSPDGRILLCEETRSAGQPTRHSWHREPAFYEDRLASLRLTYSAYIEQIDAIPGLVSPGRVMLFE
jgi:ubiquinone/menaquinone biosynthesis C-methylase UbiE